MDEMDYTCPYCGEGLARWEPAAESGWDCDMYLCENDTCEYFTKGRKKVSRDYEANFGYRYCYDPIRRRAVPLAAWCGGHLSLRKGRCV
jgi:hypothetical protein